LGANIELKNLEDRLPIGRNINVATIVLYVSVYLYCCLVINLFFSLPPHPKRWFVLMNLFSLFL